MPDETRSPESEVAKPSSVSHAASKAIFGSLISLLIGLASQVIVAWQFGAGAGMDAFLTALVVPTYLWVVLVGGLAFVFVPMFVEEEATGSGDVAWAMVGTFFWLITFCLTVIAIVGVLFAPQIIAIMAPGMSQTKSELSARMLSILIFTVPLLGLGTLMESIQNARGSFFWPAAARALGSLGNVMVLLLSYDSLGPMALVWGNFVSVLLSASVPTIPVLSHGWKRLIPLTDRRIREMMTLLAPLFIFGLVNNSNLLFERYFASMLSDGALAYLGYAYKISNMLVAVLAAGIASPILPAMARAYAQGGEKALAAQFQYILRLTLATSLPAIAVLSTAATPFVTVLFERGAFDHQATVNVSRIVLAILLGDVLFRMLGNVIGRTFYVLKDTHTYPLIRALSIGLYVIVGKLLIDIWGYVGLAIALPVEAGVCIAIGFFLLGKRLSSFLSPKLVKDAFLYITASSLAALAIWLLHGILSSLPVLLELVIALGIAGPLYIVLLLWFDRDMAESVIEIAGLRQIVTWVRTGPLRSFEVIKFWPQEETAMHIVLLHFYQCPNPVYSQLATELRIRGHQVWVGYINQERNLEWHDGEHPVTVEGSPIYISEPFSGIGILSRIARRAVFLSVMLRIRRFLRQIRPDIVQINPIGAYGSWLLSLFMPENMKFVLDFRQAGMGRDSGSLLSGLRRLRDQLTNQQRQLMGEFFFDRIFFCDTRAAKMCLGEKWARWATAIPAGVGSHFLTFEYSESDPPPDEERVRFVYLGAVGRFRQLEQLFSAVQGVKRETNGFRVALIGPDVSDGYYHHLVEELGLTDVLTIKPSLPYKEVPAEVARYDVALAYVPSNIPDWRYQPTLKVLEYRALGMPIIALDNPPNRELVQNGVNGLIVQDNPEDWTQAILELIRDRDLIGRLRANARRMRTGLPWKSISAMYEETYEQLLSSSVPRSLQQP